MYKYWTNLTHVSTFFDSKIHINQKLRTVRFQIFWYVVANIIAYILATLKFNLVMHPAVKYCFEKFDP